MNDAMKNVFAAFVHRVEHALCADKLDGISEYSDTYKAGVTDYISGVNDMAREIIREVERLVDNEQQV
nr:MAG TPA: protein of unknown function (DUF4706) [Caudoviricetes sp.]